jgi:hypothetical protein
MYAGCGWGGRRWGGCQLPGLQNVSGKYDNSKQNSRFRRDSYLNVLALRCAPGEGEVGATWQKTVV